MPVSASILVAAVVAAVPTTKMPWFEFHDYPNKAFERHEEGVTRFDLLVAPDGHVANCTIEKSSGYADLDNWTCFLAKRRARFAPARTTDGQPAYGVYRTQAVWRIPVDTLEGVVRSGPQPLENVNPGPDLEVSVNALPEGTQQPPVVKLAFIVDPQGRASDCTPLSDATRQPAQLVQVACRELMSRPAEAPAKLADGQPVAAVRTAAVKFRAGSGS